MMKIINKKLTLLHHEVGEEVEEMLKEEVDAVGLQEVKLLREKLTDLPQEVNFP